VKSCQTGEKNSFASKVIQPLPENVLSRAVRSERSCETRCASPLPSPAPGGAHRGTAVARRGKKGHNVLLPWRAVVPMHCRPHALAAELEAGDRRLGSSSGSCAGRRRARGGRRAARSGAPPPGVDPSAQSRRGSSAVGGARS
jgi:hypothetical protein